MYDQLASNKRRSAFLIIAFIILVVAVASAFNYFIGGGPIGFIIAGLVAGGSAFFSYWKSDSIALAISRAKPADPQQPSHAQLINIVEGLTIAAGIPMPRVYVVDDPAPNAFATGRNPQHAEVAATTGLLEKLNRVELEGVMAHELSHIRNYDILVSTLAVTMVGIIALLSDWGLRVMWFGGGRRDSNSGGNPLSLIILIVALVLLILSPIIASLMQMAVSRRRESLADMSGVELTRYPPGLIAALEKLKADQTVVSSASKATAHLWIEQPISHTKEEGGTFRLNKLFNTHPPLDERIKALREL